LASFANHQSNDGHEAYRVTLAHYLDPRIYLFIYWVLLGPFRSHIVSMVLNKPCQRS